MLFSEPKIPQSKNSSTTTEAEAKFQCSSASRKFLNFLAVVDVARADDCFSALQRAENSSMRGVGDPFPVLVIRFSALQRAENSSMGSVYVSPTAALSVSVLFSEPKIPQYFVELVDKPVRGRFQCSSASRKFLNSRLPLDGRGERRFQCSSASRKFLNPDPRTCVHPYFRPR